MVAAKQSSERLRLDRSLVGLAIAYDGKEKVARARHDADVSASYRRGYDAASGQYNQQILDFRSEVSALRESAFSQLDLKFQTLVREARDALMILTHDCVARALGGFEMTSEAIASVVEAIVIESGLDDERMEVRLHPLDIALLEDLDSDLRQKHPGLEFLADPSLRRGDCMLSSRFGKIDGLMATKLGKLKGNLRPT